HDEAEMVAVAVAAVRKSPRVSLIGVCVEQAALPAVLGDAFPLQVAEMGGQRRAPAALPHHPRLDHGAAGPRAGSVRRQARGPAAAEGAPAGCPTLAQPPGPLRRRERLADEGLGSAGRPRADTA